MAKCVDCRYSFSVLGVIGKYECRKHTMKPYFDLEQNACSDYDSDDDNSHSCYECEYFSENILGKKCTKQNKRINEWDRACFYFIDS